MIYDYLIFLPLNFRYGFFVTPSLILSHLELLRIVTKVNFKYFNGNFAEVWFFEKFIFELDVSSYTLKITCILSRQVISVKILLSPKFTILISWSHVCILLILLLALMKLASTSAATIYKRLENKHPWQNYRVRQKELDKTPFILILDWILVYTSLTMWMDLSPYPNLRKAEKLKYQSTLKVLQKDFYSVHLTHELCIQQIVEMCKSSLFLIASVFH